MHINFKDLSPNQSYGAMIQTIVPRPIAWVLSDNGDSTYNVAPFSFFTGVCSDPPLLMLSIGKKNASEEKDTRVNIRERHKFVVHIPSTKHLDQVNSTSATLAHGESEIDVAKLTLVDIDDFSLPRIEGCDIAIACHLYRIDEIGEVPQAVIYGEIQSVTINDDLIVDHPKGRLQLDSLRLDPLSRLGGSNYGGLGDVLVASRPK